MEKRLSNRIPVNLEARIISGDKTYEGFIKNVTLSLPLVEVGRIPLPIS